MSAQTVNWQELHAWAALSRMHWRYALWQRRWIGLALLYLLLVATFNPGWRLWLLGGVALILLTFLLGMALYMRQLRAMAAASGEVQFRCDGQTIYASSRLGDFRIPASEIRRLNPFPEGLLVTYAAGSVLTLPGGAVKDALLAAYSPPSRPQR